MKTVCTWCLTPLEVKDTFNPLKNAVFCCDGCRGAEVMFNVWMSDEECARRMHYDELTGGDDEPSED